MNYMPRLARLKVIVMTSSDVVEHEDIYMLFKSKKDLADTAEKYKEMYSKKGEVFIRTDMLNLSYSNALTNDLATANAEFIP